MPRLKQADTGMDEQPDLFVHRMPGHYIRRVQQVAVRLFAEGVDGDITPVQFAALATISDSPGIGQAALAAMIGYDRATIGGVVDRLEAKGWATRSADANDRRSKILMLTDAGRKALAAARPQVEAVQEKLLAPLGESERRQYQDMCCKILAVYGG